MGTKRNETVTSTATRQQFLDHVYSTQIPEAKAVVFKMHYDTMKREMQRRGGWRADARFLDVGCGQGLSAEYWHSLGLQVTGVDLDEDLIAHARSRAAAKGLSLRYEVGSADRVPFEDRAFDIVYANSLLEHVPDWERCVDEWVRVLASGGLLWIETTNVLCPRQAEFRWIPLYSWWPGFMKRLVVHLARGPFPSLANYTPWPAVHWFSFFQLRTFLEARGLSVRDRFDCLDMTRIGMAKRLVRNLAVSSEVARRFAYVLVSPLVVIASRSSGLPAAGNEP